MDRDSAVLNWLPRRDSDDLYQMQRAHGRGPFTGHARKLSADVDARTTVYDMRQYRGPADPPSPDHAARSKSQPTGHALGLGEKGRSAGSGVVG